MQRGGKLKRFWNR